MDFWISLLWHVLFGSVALRSLLVFTLGTFIKVTKSGTCKRVQLAESPRGDDGKPRQRTVTTLGRLDQMDRSLENRLQGLMRATGRVVPEKVSDAVEFESWRSFGDVWALNCLWLAPFLPLG